MKVKITMTCEEKLIKEIDHLAAKDRRSRSQMASILIEAGIKTLKEFVKEV